MSKLSMCAVVSVAVAFAVSAQAAGDAKVSFRGCPARGVEAGCIVVKSGGKVYDVSAATPPIEVKGLGVSGTGTISGDPNTCMQGTRLKDIKYTYTKMKCPKAK